MRLVRWSSLPHVWRLDHDGRVIGTLPVHSWSVGDRILEKLGGIRAVIDIDETSAAYVIERATTVGYDVQWKGETVTFKARFATSGLKSGQLTLVTEWSDRYMGMGPQRSIYSGAMFTPCPYGVKEVEGEVEKVSDNSPDIGDGLSIFDGWMPTDVQAQYRMAQDPTDYDHLAPMSAPNLATFKGTKIDAGMPSVSHDGPIGIEGGPVDARMGDGSVKCVKMDDGARLKGKFILGVSELAESGVSERINYQFTSWWPKSLVDKLIPMWAKLQSYALDLVRLKPVELAKRISNLTPYGKAISDAAYWCEIVGDETLIRTPFFMDSLAAMLEEKWRSLVISGGLVTGRAMLRLDSKLEPGSMYMNPTDVGRWGLPLPQRPNMEVVVHRSPEVIPSSARVMKLVLTDRCTRGSMICHPSDVAKMSADADGDHLDVMIPDLCVLPEWGHMVLEWHREIEKEKDGRVGKIRGESKPSDTLYAALLNTYLSQVGLPARAREWEAIMYWVHGCEMTQFSLNRQAKFRREIQNAVDATKRGSTPDLEWLEHELLWTFGGEIVVQDWDKDYFPETVGVPVGTKFVFKAKITWQDAGWIKVANNRQIWRPRGNRTYRVEMMNSLVSNKHWIGDAYQRLAPKLPRLNMLHVSAYAVRHWIPDGVGLYAQEVQEVRDFVHMNESPLIEERKKINDALAWIEDNPSAGTHRPDWWDFLDEKGKILPESAIRGLLKKVEDKSTLLHQGAQAQYANILDAALEDGGIEEWWNAVGRLWSIHHASRDAKGTDMWLSCREHVMWALAFRREVIYPPGVSHGVPVHDFDVVTPSNNWSFKEGRFRVRLTQHAMPRKAMIAQYIVLSDGSELMVGDRSICLAKDEEEFEVKIKRQKSPRCYVLEVVDTAPRPVPELIEDTDEDDILRIAMMGDPDNGVEPQETGNGEQREAKTPSLSERLTKAGYTITLKEGWWVAVGRGRTFGTQDSGHTWFERVNGVIVEVPISTMVL